MPTYVYRREDGTKFEIKQRITDDPLEECPETGQPVERLITGSAGLIFKGDGFYITDYARKNSSSGRPASEGDGSENGTSANGASEGRASTDAASETSGDAGSGSTSAASDA